MAYVEIRCLTEVPREVVTYFQLPNFWIDQGRIVASAGPGAVLKCGPLANV